MIEIALEAPAKINLALDIVGEDGLGFHLLDGVMLRVDRADKVTVALSGDKGIRVMCSGPFASSVPLDGHNLAAKAAKLFCAESREPLRGLLIKIEKNIPTQAGLAGGSADAAAVLRGLSVLFDRNCPLDALERMGLALGADVPFCLRGGCVRARGRGEQMNPLPMPTSCIFAVAKPAAGTSTKEAFSRYDSRESEPPRPDIPAILRAISANDPALIGRAMGNVFEAFSAPPEVEKIKAFMQSSGALGAVMTGSGTAVAGLFAEEELALRCVEALRMDYIAFLARPMQ